MDYSKMKKEQLTERCEAFEVEVRELRKDLKELEELFEDTKTKKKKIGKREGKTQIVLSLFAHLLYPYFKKFILNDEDFDKAVHEIAYDAAGDWGSDNWVQCGHDPLDE